MTLPHLTRIKKNSSEVIGTKQQMLMSRICIYPYEYAKPFASYKTYRVNYQTKSP